MSRKPKVLVVASTFPVNPHTAEPRFVADLCARLKDSYAIHVLTQSRPNGAPEETREDIHITRYRYAPKSMELLSENGGMMNALKQNVWLYGIVPFFLFFQCLSIIKLIKKEKPDIIHAHWILPQGLCAVVARIFSTHKPKIVITGHGADVYGFSSSIFKRLKVWILKHTDTFCVVSHAMQEYATNNFSRSKESTPVMPMGVNLEDVFLPSESTTDICGQMLFVGRLVEKKGLIHLINALPDLTQKHSELKLVVAGDGPELDFLQKESGSLIRAGKIEFLGPLSHHKIASLYQQSEMAVFPFIEAESGDVEGLGLVVIEAMASKCPVIAGNVPAISDTVTDGETGLIVDPLNPEAIVDTVSRLHMDASLRRKLAHSAYTFVHQNYSWKICAARYKNLFHEILN